MVSINPEASKGKSEYDIPFKIIGDSGSAVLKKETVVMNYGKKSRDYTKYFLDIDMYFKVGFPANAKFRVELSELQYKDLKKKYTKLASTIKGEKSPMISVFGELELKLVKPEE